VTESAIPDFHLFVEDDQYWREVISIDRTLPAALPLNVYTAENAIILPLKPSSDRFHNWDGGVVDRDGKFIAGHIVDTRHDHRQNIVRGYPVPSDIDFVAEPVIFGGGRDARHFGHFLLEELSRLWYYVENRELNYKVAFINNGLNFDHPSVALLTQLGLDRDNMLFIERPTQFQTVIVPDQSMYIYSGEIDREHGLSVFDALRDSVKPGGADRIYLTRTMLPPGKNFRDVNENMLEDFFRKQGYQIVAPETHPLPQQISLLSGAKEVVCTVGTLSHLLLFCHNGIEHTAILRDKRSPVEIQWEINRLRGVVTNVVDCLLEFLPSSHTGGVHFFTTTPQWSRFVSEHFGVSTPAAPTSRDVVEYIRNWTEMLEMIPDTELRRVPPWTVADLASAMSNSILGRPLNAEAQKRLTSHFRVGYADADETPAPPGFLRDRNQETMRD